MADLQDSVVVGGVQSVILYPCPSIQTLTVGAILARVRKNLNDAGVTFYRAKDLLDSIQDYYDEVAAFTGCIEKTASIAFEAEKIYYDFATLISDYCAIRGIYSSRVKRWLIPSMSPELDGFRYDWEVANGETAFFYPVNFKWTAVFPVVKVSSGYMHVWYAAQAPTVTLSDIPIIPPDNMDVLEDAVTADMLDQAEEYTKADVYWKTYQEKLAQLKHAVGTRKYPDKTKILGG